MAIEWKSIRFYKTEAENKKENENFTNIDINMNIKDVKKSNDGEIRVDFTYSADFAPSVASLSLSGYVIVGGDKKELDGFIDAWKKKKTLPKELSEPLANLITYSSQLNGVLVTRALNMPAPVLPPRLQVS